MNDNELIAEFMEMEKENGLWNFTTLMDDYTTDVLYFDSSWDWLMPVYLKVCEDISPIMDGTNGAHDSSIGDMGIAILDGDKEEAIKYGAVAIKWYNENK